MTSKIFHVVFFVEFACCTTVTTVGDHFGGQNDDSNANFSQQKTFVYLRDQQVSALIKYLFSFVIERSIVKKFPKY